MSGIEYQPPREIMEKIFRQLAMPVYRQNTGDPYPEGVQEYRNRNHKKK